MARARVAAQSKTYNLLLPVEDWKVLAKISHEQSKAQGKQVSVGQLIRDAYKAVYYEELDEA